jgi:hypothetical protein
MSRISDRVNRKFTDVIELDDEWEIETDSGWQPLTHVNQTVEYDVWVLELDTGEILECADDHIVYLVTGQEIFVKHLDVGDKLLTKTGLGKITHIEQTTRTEQMYDVTVDSDDHRFYSNDILSHNTTVAAGYLLWYAMFKPDSTILVASNKGVNASEIMTRIRYAYENCPDHIRAGATEYNKGSISFDNGSRLVSSTTTETTGRGMSLTLVYLDEFAFVRNTIAKEFWTSLSPTLATGGKCIVTSTPNSDDDQFAMIWKAANKMHDEYGNPKEVGINGFRPLLATWDEHPDRDDTWANTERASIGEERFRREHNCEFLIFEETLVNSIKLADLEGTEPVQKTGQVRWYKKPNPTAMYSVSLDPAAGTGGDYAAIQVIEVNTLEQVAEWQHNQTPIEGQVRTMRDIMNYLRDEGVYQIYWSVENNTIGEAALVTIRDTGEENFAGQFLTEPKRRGQAKRRGFTTSQRTKNESCVMLKRMIEENMITIHSKQLISELKNFVARGNSFAAKVGEHDDLVMSLLLNIRMMDFIATFEEEVYNVMHKGIKMNTDSEDEPLPIMF